LIKHTIVALSAALMLAAPAYAQDEPSDAPAPAQAESAEQTLLPESVNLEVVEGSTVPQDCQFPETISDTERFELACVTMPRFSSSLVGAAYLGQLGQLGWRQGDYIDGGMTAVRTDESNCERVLNMFPADFPPGETASPTVVIWFVLERAPRCAS
jgi:hypothetical protein